MKPWIIVNYKDNTTLPLVGMTVEVVPVNGDASYVSKVVKQSDEAIAILDPDLSCVSHGFGLFEKWREVA